MQLYEKLRPKTWAELCGCERLKQQIELLRKHGGLAGRAYWIVGLSGTGKSTVARLIAGEVAEPWAVDEVNGSDVSVDMVRDWEREARYRPISGQTYCHIINESHGLRISGQSNIVSRLLTTLELPEVQQNVTFIFTTTTAGNTLFADAFDANPFGSRCECLTTNVSDLEGGLWLRKMTPPELNGQALDDYINLFKHCRGNLRECLSIIGKGGMATC
jgi:replication-associated recombination protein RarA